MPSKITQRWKATDLQVHNLLCVVGQFHFQLCGYLHILFHTEGTHALLGLFVQVLHDNRSNRKCPNGAAADSRFFLHIFAFMPRNTHLCHSTLPGNMVADDADYTVCTTVPNCWRCTSNMDESQEFGILRKSLPVLRSFGT